MLSVPSAPRSIGEYLLYPAATSPHKNHRLLVDFVERYSDAPRVICVGPLVGEEGRSLPAVAEERGLSSRIEFRGMVSDAELDILMSNALAVVMPTLFEAASGPIMEAFVRGVPVLAADIPPLRSQVDMCGGVVEWFDPTSAASLAEAVTGLYAHYSVLEEGARSGGQYYGSLDWADTCSEYLQVIMATTDNHRSSCPISSC
jgi:glycosyltransferase involved in cell wall biosynthesis